MTIISEGIVSLVWIACTALVAFLAWRESIPWYLFLLSIIAAAAFSLMFLNQFRSSFDKQKIKSDKWLENSIVDWLKETGHLVTPPKERNPNKIFQIIAVDTRVDPQNRDPLRIEISLSESEHELLFLDSTLLISHTNLNKWDDNVKGKWRRAIHLDLLRLGVFFGDEVTQNKDLIFYIHSYIQRENINKINIIDQITTVKRGSIIVRELMRQFAEGNP